MQNVDCHGNYIKKGIERSNEIFKKEKKISAKIIRRLKLTKFWPSDENFSRRIILADENFSRRIILADEILANENFSRRKF